MSAIPFPSPTYLVGPNVPVFVLHELILEFGGVLEEVPLVAGPPQQVLDPLALPGVSPLAPVIIEPVALGSIFRSFAGRPHKAKKHFDLN